MAEYSRYRRMGSWNTTRAAPGWRETQTAQVACCVVDQDLPLLSISGSQNWVGRSTPAPVVPIGDETGRPELFSATGLRRAPGLDKGARG